nr:MAG TPA: hypothetical protein [Caudoviricetes sp.]
MRTESIRFRSPPAPNSRSSTLVTSPWNISFRRGRRV